MPIVTAPASFSRAIVVPASNFTSVSTAAVFFDASEAWLPASLAQPARNRPAAAARAAYRVVRMGDPFRVSG